MDKKSVLLYLDSLNVLDSLTDEQAWKLIKKIRAYSAWIEYDPKEQLIDVVFVQFKNYIDANTQKYHDTCEKNKNNVRKRWNTKNTTVYDRIPNDTKYTDKDTDTDTDTDTDKEKWKNRVTDLWLKYELVGNKSEQPEINPIPTGNKSDTQPEKFPTYNNTIYNKNIIYSLDFVSDDVKELFIAFIEIRKKREKWLSDIAIKNLHKELHKLSTDPVTQCAIINKSITNNRKWLFKLDIREINANIQKIQIAYQQEVAKDKENKKAIWDKFISEYWSDTMQQVLDKINTSSFISSLL